METIVYGVTGVVMVGSWIAGSLLARQHGRRLARLEAGSSDVLAITLEELPAGWDVESCDLVVGNVCISLDYVRRIVANLKGLVGGRIGVYEPLLDRARREALVRMKDQARARGHDTIVNVRIETSPLASARRDGKGIAGVEILAFGTALTVRKR